MYDLRPLSNNLVIKGTEKEKQTTFGIIIPDTAREGRPTTGKIVAIGPKVQSVKVGDKVLMKGYMTDEVLVNEEKYLICQEEAVIGIINDA